MNATCKLIIHITKLDNSACELCENHMSTFQKIWMLIPDIASSKNLMLHTEAMVLDFRFKNLNLENYTEDPTLGYDLFH